MSALRQSILSQFSGTKAGNIPTFSGLISVTEPGLEREGLAFHETHHDAERMARAAASTYRLSGFASAVVPLDMYVEAEALGAGVDYREGARAEYPRLTEFLYKSVEEFTTEITENAEKKNENYASFAGSVVQKGRILVTVEAIRLLKVNVGNEIVIGGYLPGPFTLLSLLVETGALYMALRKPEGIHTALRILTQVLAGAGNAYHAAGADYLTVHEMGGSPGALGPKTFEAVVLPHLQALFSALPRPAVLSCCGRTNGAMKLLAASDADALSVDQTNDLAASREEVPEALLFGNLDPVGTLSQGTPEAIREAVEAAVQAGVDAVWPGCDLHLRLPPENLRALVEASIH
jgi:[methyl-Co(III) methanol-specific corrinoid protein]:coenzyme M methyltransferase